MHSTEEMPWAVIVLTPPGIPRQGSSPLSECVYTPFNPFDSDDVILNAAWFVYDLLLETEKWENETKARNAVGSTNPCVAEPCVAEGVQAALLAAGCKDLLLKCARYNGGFNEKMRLP